MLITISLLLIAYLIMGKDISGLLEMVKNIAGAAMLFIYMKIKDRITPEINFKVEDTLNEWLVSSMNW